MTVWTPFAPFFGGEESGDLQISEDAINEGGHASPSDSDGCPHGSADQSVTIILVRSAWSIGSNMENNHCRTDDSVDKLICSTITGLERAHIHLDMVHSMRE
jgi:hypothetical protein